MSSRITESSLSMGEIAFTVFRLLPLATSVAFLTAVYHQSIIFNNIHSMTPLSQRSATLTFNTVRAFGHDIFIFASIVVVGDLSISLLNIFWHPQANPDISNQLKPDQIVRYLYLLSFVMKVLHFFPHRQATRLRNAMRAVERTDDKAAEEMFQAMDDWVKLAARRWLILDLPTLAVTLAAVTVWSMI